MGWFSRVRGKVPKAPASEPAIPTHVRHASTVDVVEVNHADADGYSDDSAHSRNAANPLSSGARLATVHLSPSETNLYLQALAGLDDPKPNLPLWAEPAPALPDLAIDAEPIPAPNIPYPTTPDIIPALHPNRQNRQHGLLVLSGDAGVQISGFPAIVVADLDAALRTWKLGISSRSEDLDYMAKRHPEMAVCWKAELKGKVWRLKGTLELESIRLLLAIFGALAHHGYTMVGSIQPSISKPESHNLLFKYTADVEEFPPLFFAVTLPLPDRISLVNPPPRLSGQLLTSFRTAITNLHRPPPQPTLSHFKAIKLEGWVHPGVYRFWLAGLRRWPAGAGGVKRDVVARLQPLLVLAITDAAKSLNMQFVGSIPLLPRTAARDVLIFSSLPESGLCHRDAYSEESERNRVSAIIRSASARSRQGSADGHTNGSSSAGQRGSSLIDRPHPVHSHGPRGGSQTSTDFYPGAHASTAIAPAKPSLQKHASTDFYTGPDGTPSISAKPSLHKLQTQTSYDESTFSRPSGRMSFERGRRTSADRRSSDSRRPSHASQLPAYREEARPGAVLQAAPEPPRMPFANASSPTISPVSPTSTDSHHITYNDFLYHPLGNGPGSVPGSLRTPSGSFGMAAIPSPSMFIQPRRLSGGPLMVYPPLSPGHAAQRTEGHIPLLSIDSHAGAGSDSDSVRSQYSSDSRTRRTASSNTNEDRSDEWNPVPPRTILSPVSDISSPFVTPPSSPALGALARARSRSPNPYAVSGTPPLPAAAVVPSSPLPAPLPSRSPHRLPPIAAAHQSPSRSRASSPISPVGATNGAANGAASVPYAFPRGDAHAHADVHAENVRLISRDRAAMLSRASVMSLESHISTASSRPPGVGSTRTRINLSMSRE